MAERFIWVDVERTETSAVLLALDDEDPRYAEWFEKGGKLSIDVFGLAIEDAEGACEFLDDSDWQTDTDFETLEISGFHLISESEAKKYRVWDCRTQDEWRPGEVSEYVPTGAERRAAAEQAGQLRLVTP